MTSEADQKYIDDCHEESDYMRAHVRKVVTEKNAVIEWQQEEIRRLREALEDMLNLDSNTKGSNDDLLRRIAASRSEDGPWCCAVLNARAALRPDEKEPR